MHKQIDWDMLLRTEHYTNVKDIIQQYQAGYIYLYQAVIGYLVARIKGPMTKDVVNYQLYDSPAYIADKLGFEQEDYKHVYNACAYLRKMSVCWQESSPIMVEDRDGNNHKAYRWLFGYGCGNPEVVDISRLCRNIVKDKTDSLTPSDNEFCLIVSDSKSERIRQPSLAPADKAVLYSKTSKNEVQPTRQAKNDTFDKIHTSLNILFKDIDEEGPRENAGPKNFDYEQRQKHLDEFLGN